MEKNILRSKSYNIIRSIGRITDEIVANNHLPNTYDIQELEKRCDELVNLMKKAKEYDYNYKY